MHFHKRQLTILQLLDSRNSVSIVDLVVHLNVSEMTVRRDLNALQQKGLLQRVHGGAISIRGRSYEPPFLIRNTKRIDEKKRIGQMAANLVKNGDSITLDVGTTTLEIARHFSSKSNITVVTSSFRIASLLVEQPGIRLILTGGILRAGELSLVGNLAERAFKEFFVDKLFLGIAGIDLKAGLTEFNLEDSLVKKSMLCSAKEVVVVADASKFDKVAFATVAPLTVINAIVTDSSLDHATCLSLEEMGIKVHLA